MHATVPDPVGATGTVIEATPAGLDADLSGDWTRALLSVGHQPRVELSSEQRALFRSFQANLISLLSHELRTPLMAVLNALSAVDEKGAPLGGMSLEEVLETARRQARQLEATLLTTLDLAAWESGTLRVTLGQSTLRDCLAQSTLWRWGPRRSEPKTPMILADPTKLSRAFSLVAAFIESCRSSSGENPAQNSNHLGEPEVELLASGRTVRIRFHPDPTKLSHAEWLALWHEIEIAREAGASLPLNVFSRVLGSEQSFLSRTREGLGAELHLAAEIFRQHDARFSAELGQQNSDSLPMLSLQVELPPIQGEARVLRWLQSRIWSPGASAPQKLLIRAGIAPLPDSAAPNRAWLDPQRGLWIEVDEGGGERGVSGSETLSGPGVQLRCPEEGFDANELLARVISAFD